MEPPSRTDCSSNTRAITDAALLAGSRATGGIALKQETGLRNRSNVHAQADVPLFDC
jgi:hypothetical protein